MFKKVLIANRGEIALRVIRACRELGIRSVAVHSEADVDALHTRLADEAVCIGPAAASQSYLHAPAIIAAAEITGADAIHPGYGFLSENADFAATCRDCGLVFIGPSSESIRAWGDKLAARALAARLGLPLLPASGGLRDLAEALREAERLGFPLIAKAAHGGGGRGMTIVHNRADLEHAFARLQTEASAAFGNGTIYLERFIAEPRHVEFQLVADRAGTVRVLGERDCSIQRRHQKLIEEAPCTALTDELRKDMSATLRRAFEQQGYESLGTVEFLMDPQGALHFLEVNTRIQVEHGVTELVTGVDLVAWQLRIAAGEELALPEKELAPRGHAIECRINAEDPVTFAPSPGSITEYHPPGGAGVRCDSGVYGGWRVPPHYDSLLAKVLVHGGSRREAIARMQRALSETIVGGVKTNLPLHQRLLAHPDFQRGAVSTAFLERTLALQT